jgi:dephospho-CoA kinase
MVTDLKHAARPKHVIGISGGTGAGKTTAAGILCESGYFIVRVSDVLNHLLPRLDGQPRSRKELQALGEQVHEDFGQRWLDQRVLEAAKNHPQIVIDGLRFPEDHAFFVERLGPVFTHLHVDAPIEARRARFIKRGGSKQAHEVALASPTEVHVNTMRTLSSVVVKNWSSLDELAKEIYSAVLRGRTSDAS